MALYPPTFYMESKSICMVALETTKSVTTKWITATFQMQLNTFGLVKQEKSFQDKKKNFLHLEITNS
jgi:hypothetical protein